MATFVIVKKYAGEKDDNRKILCELPEERYLGIGDWVMFRFAADGKENLGITIAPEFTADKAQLTELWGVRDACKITATLVRNDIVDADAVDLDEPLPPIPEV